MMDNNRNIGISVIICCYNSSKRIKDVLQALVVQKFNTAVLWEIILVDNASTDNTSSTAQSIWKTLNADIDFRITYENSPGLANARDRGIKESRYEYLVFCDDDNWLYPDYLQGVYTILSSNAVIAACGGVGIPVFETAKPAWFDEYAEAFATGSQEINTEEGKLLNLYGAGIALKKRSLDQLALAKFNPFMIGRVGSKLSSSEDTELTYALVLIGQTLHFSSELKFYHYLPKERLQFSYLKKLFVAFGNDGPVRNLYYANISNRFFHKQVRHWGFHFLLSLFRLVKYAIVPPKKGGRVIYFNWSKAYIKSLFALRNSYADIQSDIYRIKKFSLQTSAAADLVV
jgi:glycosyltransferase involved in cell wall biosynthesis